MVAKHKKTVFLAAGLSLLMASAAVSQTVEQNTYARLLRTGAEQMKSGDYQAARDSFSEALRYNDSDPAAHLGLGIAYFYLFDDTSAEQELTKAATINPKNAQAYEFLGEIYYRKDDLETAASYWKKAAAANPADAKLRSRLEHLRKEQKAEKNFDQDETSHFLIKYEGRENAEAGKVILRVLEDAYDEIGGALAFYPTREIQVILYSDKQFQEVTDAPGWSGAIFDGKIRIPIAGVERETPGLRRLLYHEYTHAAVNAITQRCPTWLNEGLAQYFEGRRVDSRQREQLLTLVHSGKLPSLSHLEGSFLGLGGNDALTAYLVSLSAVRYMVDTFGLYRVKGVLVELSAGADTGKAMNDGLFRTYDEFEQGWKRSLE
jgi:tetratricopeptide (TPR) repeat protein